MFAVIFEVQPKPSRWAVYLGLAKRLKPDLERVDGFIDNERFASKRHEGRLLSLSTWRDEKAVIRWRSAGFHHEVQETGRREIFENYHLRVGEISADTHVPAGQSLAQQRFDATEIAPTKAVTISELSPAEGGATPSADLAAMLGAPIPGTAGIVAIETFESIYAPGKLLLLAAWIDEAAAQGWTPRRPPAGTLRHRQVRIIRDYGMFDRREAPQYHPEAKPAHEADWQARARALGF
ncbi:MAG TPA: antibiotic biosynthesis monooxygenase [Alphaproteobacteria bacterium]|nr:antibiotic biosynthesis monooxygenase [Alphaproteobacteria bacterium]